MKASREPHPNMGPGPYGRDTSPDVKPPTPTDMASQPLAYLERAEQERDEQKQRADRAEARVKELEEALNLALEQIAELRAYAQESWDWKYGERWNEEEAQVRAALKVDKP